MKAVVVTEQAAGTAGMRLAERPRPEAAGNDVLVEVHASGFTSGELTWPSNWTDRLGRDRTPSIPGHELAGVVSALGYGTAGLSVGRRVFGLMDWARDGALAECAAVEARGEVVQQVRGGRLRTVIGNVATLDDAVAASMRPSGSEE